MRTLLINTNKPYEQPFPVHQHIVEKIHLLSTDSRSIKIINTTMNVLVAVMAATLIILAGIRFQDNRIAYQYLAQVTHSVPFTMQQ